MRAAARPVHGRRRPASAELVEKLVAHWIDDGYDVVYTAKAHRDNESFLRRQAARLLRADQLGRAAEDPRGRRRLPPAVAARRHGAAAASERNRFFKGLSNWIGFRQIRVDYEPAPRAHGVTTFSPGRLIGLSIEGLTSFSVAPLRGEPARRAAADQCLPVRPDHSLGGLDHRQAGPGYPSLMIGLMTIGGVQLIMIGIVGEYIGKILSELKARSIYFVAEHSEKRADGETRRRATAERTAAE